MDTMTTQEQREAVKLIREGCSNYVQGQCAPLDTPCPQCHSYSILCRHFADKVLPGDRALHAKITDGASVKRCMICNGSFVAASNRAKYCSECASRQRKKQEAERLRRRRAG